MSELLKGFMFHEPKEGATGQGWGLLTSVAIRVRPEPLISHQRLLSFVQLLFTFSNAELS